MSHFKSIKFICIIILMLIISQFSHLCEGKDESGVKKTEKNEDDEEDEESWRNDKAYRYCAKEPEVKEPRMNELLEKLTYNYDLDVPPVLEDGNANGCPINLKIDLKIEQIFEVNEIEQTLTFMAELYLRWTDKRLAWNHTSLSHDVRWTFIPKNRIWMPDIYLYENMAKEYASDMLPRSYVLLKYDGSIRFNMPMIAKTSCQINIANFPYDVQTCNISLGSYVMDDRYIRLTRVIRLTKADEQLYENDQWKLNKFRTVKYYSKDPQNNNFSVISFQIELERKPLFYMIYLVSPVIFMAFLAPAVFLIPVESGERISYSVTLLLTLMIFLQIVMTLMPKTSTEMPKISIFYLTVITKCALTLIVNIIIVNIHHRAKIKHRLSSPLPKYLITIFTYLAYLTCCANRIPSYWKESFKAPHRKNSFRNTTKNNSINMTTNVDDIISTKSILSANNLATIDDKTTSNYTYINEGKRDAIGVILISPTAAENNCRSNICMPINQEKNDDYYDEQILSLKKKNSLKRFLDNDTSNYRSLSTSRSQYSNQPSVNRSINRTLSSSTHRCNGLKMDSTCSHCNGMMENDIHRQIESLRKFSSNCKLPPNCVDERRTKVNKKKRKKKKEVKKYPDVIQKQNQSNNLRRYDHIDYFVHNLKNKETKPKNEIRKRKSYKIFNSPNFYEENNNNNNNNGNKISANNFNEAQFELDIKESEETFYKRLNNQSNNDDHPNRNKIVQKRRKMDEEESGNDSEDDHIHQKYATNIDTSYDWILVSIILDRIMIVLAFIILFFIVIFFITTLMLAN
ncbi:hypothetical protein SNEBB_010184 [Seison nebaliae]|nr:hypothetical protein SNEBB_010184 [Seison nebaliae]